MSATAATAAVAPASTTLSVTATSHTVAYGGAVAISGRLVRASDNAPLPGGRVYLQQSVNGVWTNAGSVLTDGNGDATAYAVGLGVSRSWTLYWPGNATFGASRSPAVAVTVAGAPGTSASAGSTQLSIVASAANVAYGGSVAFSGRLTLASNSGPLGGGRVYLQQNVNG
ncbi:MAG TPA: hypothetical protein VGD55_13010, partial [Acidothermaceae bacterium]